ncbi:MAG: hypothetical protein ACM31L_04530 [Actinomycetota bacterium]
MMGEAKRRRTAGGGNGNGGVEQRFSMGFRITDKATGENRVMAMAAREQDFELHQNVMTLYMATVIAQTLHLQNPAVRTFQEALEVCEGMTNTLVKGFKTGCVSREILGSLPDLLAALNGLYAFIRKNSGRPVDPEDVRRHLDAVRDAFNTRISPLAQELGVKGLYQTVPWDGRAVEAVFSNLSAMSEAERDAIYVRLFPATT